MKNSRRHFIRSAMGSAVLLPFSPPPFGHSAIEQITNAGPGAANTDETYWQLIKEQFIIRPDRVMLNAANLCPAPHMVRDAVSSLADDLDRDVSFQNRGKFNGLMETARTKVARYVGAEPDEIAIVRNTSEANATIVNGLALEAGDEVLLFDQNHPTNNIAWEVRGARLGFTVKRVTIPDLPESPAQVFDLFTAAATNRTRVIAFSDVSNTSGIQMPTQALCEWARAKSIYSHVDGAQTFGALALNLHQMKCDSYASSAHKWLMGPKETGVLYVRQAQIPQVWATGVGVGWGDDIHTDVVGARKFENLGQRDDAAVAALGATIDFLNLMGAESIESRIRVLAKTLKEGLQALPGAKLRTSMQSKLSAGVCITAFEHMEGRAIFERLYQDYGIAGAPTGGLRLCPHIYNTMADIEYTLASLTQILAV